MKLRVCMDKGKIVRRNKRKLKVKNVRNENEAFLLRLLSKKGM